MKITRRIIIFSILLFSFVTLNFDKAEAANAVIDSYVTVNSVTKLSDGRISIIYTMKQDFNKTQPGVSTPQALNFVISMNSGFNITPTTQHVATTKGVHVALIYPPNVKHVGAQIVELKYGIGGYTTSERIGTSYNIPHTDWIESGRTISTTEAVAGVIVYDILPGIAVSINPQTKAIKATGKLIQGWAALVGINVAAGTMPGVPSAIANQYWHTSMRYDVNGNVHVRTRVYVNETAYKRNEQTIYDNTITMPINF